MSKREELLPTLVDLRDGILKAMGPLDGCEYAPGVVAQLQTYERKLKDHWIWAVHMRVEEEARQAVHAALRTLRAQAEQANG